MAGYSGIGRYINGLLSGLKNRSRFQYTLIKNPESQLAADEGWFYLESKTPIYSLQEQWTIPFLSRQSNCLHIPHYNAPVFTPQKLIITIHDLIHLYFKNDLPSKAAQIYASALLPAIAKRANAIIAVSEFTKKTVVEKLRINPNKINVIHHGVNPIFLNPLESAPNSNDRYFLYVGLIKTHKNVGLLISAFRKLLKQSSFSDLKLILVGRPDLKQGPVKKWVDGIKNEPGIVLKESVDDQVLKNLYSGAWALIVPSLIEGFSFPVLEAMALGVPVIGARAASIPEVLGEEAGLYFDPYSEEELISKMVQILGSETLRQQLSSKGRERSKQFTWSKAASQTESVYESVA